MRHLCLVTIVVACFGCGDDGGEPRDAAIDMDVSDTRVRLDSEFLPDVASDTGPDAEDAGVDTSDAGPMCDGVCRPDTLAGCDEGLVCALIGSEPACVEMAGISPIGGPCEMTDQCGPGLACFRDPEGGVCRPVCCPFNEGACGEGTCRTDGMLIDGSTPVFGACWVRQDCRLFAEDACPEGDACYLDAGMTDCHPEGSTPVGEACESAPDCRAGLTCVGAFDRICVRVCRLGDAEGCPRAEGTCRATADSPEGAGICMP